MRYNQSSIQKRKQQLHSRKKRLHSSFSVLVFKIFLLLLLVLIVGGGGLGAVAMNYGLYRYDDQIMFITIVIIVVIVQIFQEIGMMTAKKLDKRLK